MFSLFVKFHVVSILLGISSGERFFFDFADIHTITCASHAYWSVWGLQDCSTTRPHWSSSSSMKLLRRKNFSVWNKVFLITLFLLYWTNQRDESWLDLPLSILSPENSSSGAVAEWGMGDMSSRPGRHLAGGAQGTRTIKKQQNGFQVCFACHVDDMSPCGSINLAQQNLGTDSVNL